MLINEGSNYTSGNDQGGTDSNGNPVYVQATQKIASPPSLFYHPGTVLTQSQVNASALSFLQNKNTTSSTSPSDTGINRNKLAFISIVTYNDTQRKYNTNYDLLLKKFGSIKEYQSIPTDVLGSGVKTTYYDPWGNVLQPGTQPSYYTYNGQIVTGSELKNILQTDIQMYNANKPVKQKQFLTQVMSFPKDTLFYKSYSEKVVGNNKMIVPSFIVATPEMQNLLTSYKNLGYKPVGGDIGFYSNMPRPSDVLTQVKGVGGAKIIIGSESVMNLGLPFLYSGVAQAVTGSPFVEKQYQEYATRGLMNLPHAGESSAGALGRQLSSPEVIFDVYVPLATIGLGYAMKPFIEPFAASLGTRLSEYGTARMVMGNYVKLNALQVVKGAAIVGGMALPAYQLASTAIMNPGELPSVAGHLTSNFVMMGAGFKLGEMSYENSAIESLWSKQYMNVREGGFLNPSYDLGGSFVSGYELQGKLMTKTYVNRSENNPNEFLFHSKVMNLPERNIQVIGASVPFGETDVESLIGKNLSKGNGYANYNAFTSYVIDFDKENLNVVIGFSRGRAVDKMLGYDFLASRSQSVSIGNEDIMFGRGVNLQKSFYEGEKVIDKGFLVQREFNFDMMYSRVSSNKGLVLDVAKIYGGPDMSSSSAIVQQVVDHVYSGADVSFGGGPFESMTKSTKGYQGAFPSMNVGKGMSLSDLGSLEYGIQSSGYWRGQKQSSLLDSLSVSKQESILVSGLATSSLSSSLNINKLIQNVGLNSMTEQRTSTISGVKQITSLMNLQETEQNTVTITTPISISITDILNVSTSTPVVTPNTPFVPFIGLPSGTLSGILGGGGNEPRRRKRGARYRIHPVRLYDALYVSKRLSL